MNRYMCASIIVCCSEKNMPSLTIAPFVVSQDGKMLKRERFHRKCCDTFHWYQGIAQPEANLAPSDICFPDPSPSHVNQVQEVGGDAIAQPDVNAHIFKCILTSCLFQMMALSFLMAAQPMEVKALQSLEEASVLEVKVISLFLFVC